MIIVPICHWSTNHSVSSFPCLILSTKWCFDRVIRSLFAQQGFRCGCAGRRFVLVHRQHKTTTTSEEMMAHTSLLYFVCRIDSFKLSLMLPYCSYLHDSVGCGGEVWKTRCACSHWSTLGCNFFFVRRAGSSPCRSMSPVTLFFTAAIPWGPGCVTH